MSLASFVAAQRTDHGVSPRRGLPGAGRLASVLQVAGSAGDGPRERKERLTAEIHAIFCGSERTYGSPRVWAELRDRGWVVTERTVAGVMAAGARRAGAEETPQELDAP